MKGTEVFAYKGQFQIRDYDFFLFIFWYIIVALRRRTVFQVIDAYDAAHGSLIKGNERPKSFLTEYSETLISFLL